MARSPTDPSTRSFTTAWTPRTEVPASGAFADSGPDGVLGGGQPHPHITVCVDLTACLSTVRDDAIGPLLRELTTELRQHGPITVMTECFC